MREIKAEQYGILPNQGEDQMIRLRNLLADCQADTTICFESGEYHFYPQYAFEKLLYVSNHDEDGLKRVAFELEGRNNIHISGADTHLVFHTDLIPFHIKEARNIRISGIRIDYAVAGYSEATVVCCDEKQLLLEIDRDTYSYTVENGDIIFEGENFRYGIWHWLEMDGKRNAPVYKRGGDFMFNYPDGRHKVAWRECSPNQVAVEMVSEDTFSSEIAVGNKIVLRHHPRNYPVIFIEDSRVVDLTDVEICHGLGMGVIAQFSEDITLRRVRVVPSHGRVFSLGADATHFVSCRGLIHIAECSFANQMDDAVNVHGIYHQVETMPDRRTILVKLVHHQHKGMRLGVIGEELRFSRADTMLGYAQAKIVEAIRWNKDYCLLRLDKELDDVQAGDVVENLEYCPNVRIEGCQFRGNRARGVLLTTAGDVTVRENDFHIAGAAILIEGDSADWFESGATKRIQICQNRFVDCSYAPVWGSAPIQVSPSAKRFSSEKYHGRLEIRENDFYIFDERILKIKNVDTVIFSHNRIHRTDSFPPIAGERFVLEAVNTWTEEENQEIPS